MTIEVGSVRRRLSELKKQELKMQDKRTTNLVSDVVKVVSSVLRSQRR